MFWKLFLSFSLLIAAAIGCLGLIVAGRVDAELCRIIEESTRKEASFVQGYATEALVQGSVADRAVFKNLARQIEARITLIALDGSVLADSEAEAEQLENHGSRPEIVQALEFGQGTGRRVSSSTGNAYLYLAYRIDHASKPIGFLRFALPVAAIDSRLREVWWVTWSGALVTFLIATGLAYWISRKLNVRLDQLSSVAQSIADGKEDEPIRDLSHDSVGKLARSLEEMRQTLRERFQELERARRNLQTMLETIPDGVIAIDQQERILFVNPGIFALLGSTPTEAVGRKYWEVFRIPGLQDAVTQTLEQPTPMRTELELLEPARVLALRGRAFEFDDARGVIMVLHDISELRRLEQVRQEFVANVSHEIKTPLTAIKAFTETLIEDRVAQPQTALRFLQRIDEQADRLHHLVTDMLALARAESREQAFDIQPVDLVKLVGDCVDSFQAEAKATGLTLEFQPACSRAVVLADLEGVATVLKNLIENAVKYTLAQGVVTVIVATEDRAHVVRVTDSGIGIPERHLSRIFERFYRVDKARSKAKGGTGLGLSIVKHLVQAFGGSVSVTSRVNQGSTFTIRFPAYKPGGVAESRARVVNEPAYL